MVVEDDAPLRSALAAAAGGATVEQIVDTVAADTGFTRDEVRGYVDALLDAQVLTAVAEPAVTGRQPLAQVTSSLRAQGFGDRGRAGKHRCGIDHPRQRRPRQPAEAYRPSRDPLLELAGGGDEARLIQVDLHRTGSRLTLAATRSGSWPTESSCCTGFLRPPGVRRCNASRTRSGLATRTARWR